MGKENKQQRATSQMGVSVRYVFLAVLAIHYSAFILLLHYSRVMPVLGGRRYFTSTAVFLNEVAKLAVCLTVALYDVSKSAPPSVPATYLFSSLSSAIFSGDSWKLAVPAGLYTLANSLQYIGLSNLEAPTFQATYQLKLVSAAIFGAVLLKRNMPPAKWMSLALLLVGVAVIQFPAADPYDFHSRAHLHMPRSFKDLKNLGESYDLHKRSATYEGIEEDMMLGNPHMSAKVGVLATLGASIASGLAGVSFEKVLKDSSATTSIWIRNIQLAIYSIFPALFIGVVFLDGEKIAKAGFFEGYSWTVWATIGVHAIGGLATSFCLSYAETTLKNCAGGLSLVMSSLAGISMFDFRFDANFVLGALLVLVATYLYILTTPPAKPDGRQRPSVQIEISEKTGTSPDDPDNDDNGSPPNDFSIKLPTTPLLSEALSTSRPGSPSLHRNAPSKNSYFSSHHRDT